jgi:hypothetical protein
MHSFQTPDFARASRKIWDLPPGSDGEKIASDADAVHAIDQLGMTFETMGSLVHRRKIPLSLVQEVMGGSTVLLWARVKPFVELDRARQGRQNVYEWWQWLAERLAEDASESKRQGAHIAFADWKP